MDNKISRTSGANSIDNLLTNTFFGKNVPTDRSLETHALVLNELRENITKYLPYRYTYPELEETFVNYGYQVKDIREVFESVTGVNPIKLLNMSYAIALNTPSSIPMYNYAWGVAKKKNDGFYFVIKDYDSIYAIYHQKDDLERELIDKNISFSKIIEKLKKYVKHVYRYDIPIGDFKDEVDNTKSFYSELIESAKNLGNKKADFGMFNNMVTSALNNGFITQDQASVAFRVYSNALSKSEDEKKDTKPKDPIEVKENEKNREKDIMSNDIETELENKTPQQFFDQTKGHTDDSMPSYVSDIVSYINAKKVEFRNFDVSIKRFVFDKYDKVDNVVSLIQDKPNRNPTASVTVVLGINAKGDKNKSRFALIVFFVTPDGQVKTSDSFKGEDDLIYGFTEEGISKYFNI